MFGFKGQDEGNVWLHCVVRVCGEDCEKVSLLQKCICVGFALVFPRQSPIRINNPVYGDRF